MLTTGTIKSCKQNFIGSCDVHINEASLYKHLGISVLNYAGTTDGGVGRHMSEESWLFPITEIMSSMRQRL